MSNPSTSNEIETNLNIETSRSTKKLSYKWTPLKVVALLVLIGGIVLAIVSLIFYSQAGRSSDIYGAAWVWILIITALLLLFLSAFLLAFS